MESGKDIAQHRKRLNEDSFKIEKGREPRSSSVKMKNGAKKQTATVKKWRNVKENQGFCCSNGEEFLKRNL